MDKIHIRDLELYCKHGVYPEETFLGQKFLFDVTLYTNTRPAGLTDDLEKSPSITGRSAIRSKIT